MAENPEAETVVVEGADEEPEPPAEPQPEPEPEPQPEPEPPQEQPPQEEPPAAKPAETVDAPSNNQDALSLEFLYYGSVLKVLAPTLSTDPDKTLITPWITKLFRPEYQTTKLREKRNRYLVSLTVNLLNDEVTGIFRENPPDGALTDIRTVKPETSTAAEWELDRMWQETLLALPDDFEMVKCSVHATPEACYEDHKLDKILDQEFQFFLYLIRPYAALLPAEDKTRTASWLQTLCTIHGEHCSSMKSIRNDYMMALLGYLHDLRIIGPFTDYPPISLEPLEVAAKKAARMNPIIDPTGPDANQFLVDQPVPDDGAFCYVALTGDLIASSF